MHAVHPPTQHRRPRPPSAMPIPPSSFNTSDAASIRSSSEATAATIFSMYEDPLPPNIKDAPPVPALDPRLRYTQTNSSRPASTSSRPSFEVDYRSRSRPVSEMDPGRRSNGDPYEPTLRQRPARSADPHAPTLLPGKGVPPPVSYSARAEAVPGSRRSSASRRSYAHDGRASMTPDGRPSMTLDGRSSITPDGRPSLSHDARPSSTQGAQPSFAHHAHRASQDQPFPVRRSSLQHITDSLGANGGLNTPNRAALKPLPPSRTPSPHIAMLPPSNTNTPGGTTPQAGVSQYSLPSGDLLSPAERERRTSSKHSMQTTQTTQTTQTSQTEYTARGSTEDADAFRVRATYARLEAEGVYGDGWMEGVERTRTRVVSAGSAAVLEASKGAGGKGADISTEEEERLKSTDRYAL